MEEKKRKAAENLSAREDKTAVTQKKKRRGMLIGVCALVALAGVFLTAHTLRKNEEKRWAYISSPHFADGILINGIHVGGLTYDEAKNAVDKANAALLDTIHVELLLEGQKHAVTANDFNFAFDTEEVLNTAFYCARQGTLRQIEEELSDISANGRQYETRYTADRKSVEDFVAALAKKLDRPAVNAEFSLLLDTNVSDEVKKSAEYVTLASSKKPAESFSLTEHRDGITVDQPALTKALLRMATSKTYADMEIPARITAAAVTAEGIRKNFVLRGEASTSFAKSPYNRASRVFNIKKAAGLINGAVLQPGEVFSTNDTLGYRTYKAGWKPAPAIVQGRTEDQAGGGVCQVSTTLYNCVLKSGLEIVYRQGHSGRLSYVDGGLDATIDSGRIDFKWKNNTASPLYVFAYVDESEKKIHFEIYGEPFDDTFDEIRLSSRRVSSVSPAGPMRYIVDATRSPGYSKVWIARKSGSIWQSYATYYKNGLEVKKVSIDRTTYKAYAGETIIGPSAGAVAKISQ
ncbi:MAG: VanW family protein [Clostridiales bacterium]|jgi:vancomycin resistance protein YoaR|nr:VanW family protein [Clostridiales bacterium]